ncbi:MAG TPA: ATP-binding protein, partial [Candidatus Elarobacter sp.]|nr:ATP-binding protein [Candidatus Elarobacter sp.]
SATPLGPVAGWSQALRFAVRTAMECPFAINLWCGEDRTLIYNDAYRVVLGSKHPRALGRPGREVWAEIWTALEPMFSSIQRGEPIYAEDGHFVMERADGLADDAWFTYSLSPVRDEDGEIVAYLNVASETTQRVLGEHALREARAVAERAEQRLRAVFAQAPAFLAVLQGPEHVFEFVNDEYSQLIGHRPVLGHRVAESLPEVTEQGFIDILDDVYRTGQAFVGREIAAMLERVPGEPPEERILDFVYQPITDAEGRSTGIVVHGSDVSEAVMARREIERLLRVSEQARSRVEESEARYRFLSNTIPVQVWTAAPDGRLDYVSERTAEYFGVTDDDVLGDAWLALLHPDDVALTTERWARSITTGEPYEVEFRLRKGGTFEYRWHLARATAQCDEDGTILRWFGTNTDIEDRRRAEAELERLTHEAMEANRAKSDFLAAMSHELRTPLNAIGGYTQLIELGVRGPITDEQRVDLSRIQRSKDHLDALVSDVLNFAKAGAGRMEIRAEQIAIRRALHAVLEMIAPQAQEKQLRLESPDIPAELCAIADEDRTRQILLNLLANALKFTAPGGTISLGASATASDVAITVSDTGIGVPAAKLERIFEPFVQAEPAVRANDQGVGLGLAISRQLARAMGGDLRVASEPGVGSTFTLMLPRAAGG